MADPSKLETAMADFQNAAGAIRAFADYLRPGAVRDRSIEAHLADLAATDAVLALMWVEKYAEAAAANERSLRRLT